MDLTVFIISTGKDKSIELLSSFKELDCVFKKIEGLLSFNEEVNTEWKMFLFSDERLTEELVAAIPVFLDLGNADVYKIYKRRRNTEEKKTYFSIAPRIFRREIVLQENSLLPLNIKNIKFDTILNGFISND